MSASSSLAWQWRTGSICTYNVFRVPHRVWHGSGEQVYPTGIWEYLNPKPETLNPKQGVREGSGAAGGA